MSYDVLRDKNRRFDRQQSQAHLEDAQRLEFLKLLDRAQFEVTEWEANFIESTLQREASGERITFTDRQRVSIDKMRKFYGGRL